MVGAGIFVTIGRAGHLYTGLAIVLSYAVAGLCALLSPILRLTILLFSLSFFFKCRCSLH
ncbi:hypothetical protein AHAS_Ahas06G0259200 [Arachis hypogaea]